MIKCINIRIHKTNIEISYSDTGEGIYTLVFVHGLGCAKTDFEDAWKYMTHVRIVTFDFPGCGGSGYKTGMKLDTNVCVDIIHALREKLDLRNIIIVGHSYGGIIALKYAEKYEVNGTINIEGLWERGAPVPARKSLEGDVKDYIKKIPETIKWLRSQKNIGPHKYADTLEYMTNPHAYYQYSRAFVESIDEGESVKRFLQLELPKLFLYGAESKTPPFLENISSHIHTQSLEKSYHFPQYDNPESLYHIIGTFISSLESPYATDPLRNE